MSQGKGPKAFVDLHSLSEDDRIEMIVATVDAGNVCGIFVDDAEAADRYVRKMGDRVKVIDRIAGMMAKAPGVIFLRVGPRGH
jgi:hypothetical protein